jgi:hypothetical protein
MRMDNNFRGDAYDDSFTRTERNVRVTWPKRNGRPKNLEMTS